MRPGEWHTTFIPLRLLWRIATLPAQFFLATPLLSVVVPRAFDNLLRRTKAMFRPPREFDPNIRPPGYRPPDGAAYRRQEGAMARLLRHLGRALRKHPELPLKVSVIAHSMGARIANQALRHSPDLPWDSLVYMAPACPVRDFEEAVSPVLHRHRSAEAYVLNLHPRVEASQRDFGGLAPVGSVLEWLEGFLTPPHAWLDRFLGKWDNVLRTLHIFRTAVRKRIHLKSFPYDEADRRKPYRHVHFNDPDTGFWRRSFWT